MSSVDRELMLATGADRLEALLASYRRLLGKDVAENAEGLWHAPAAIVAHDTRPVPEFFFANACALTLFKMNAAQFIGMPSHESAEPQHRDERAAMLAKLEADDMVTGYSGVRIAADGSRFVIGDAVIFNLRDDAGRLVGQAAWFEDVDFL